MESDPIENYRWEEDDGWQKQVAKFDFSALYPSKNGRISLKRLFKKTKLSGLMNLEGWSKSLEVSGSHRRKKKRFWKRRSENTTRRTLYVSFLRFLFTKVVSCGNVVHEDPDYVTPSPIPKNQPSPVNSEHPAIDYRRRRSQDHWNRRTTPTFP